MTSSCRRFASVLTLAISVCCPVSAGEAVAGGQRALAASQTAESAASCLLAQPFYWEIGDAHSLLAAGQAGAQPPMRTSRMPIASASKWIYAAYVAEQHKGVLTEEDIRFLTFRSGYTRLRICTRRQTVGECMNSLLNGKGEIDRETTGKFDYNGGHMQKHAMLMGLADSSPERLGEQIRRGLPALGPDWGFGYAQAQPAGGGAASAADYARFLQALLSGRLQLGALLGSHAVCTQPASCPDTAVKTPIPASERWQYSIGHWIESDPQLGDGSFSSPGAFGFYPWISRDHQFYGLVARDSRRHLMSREESDKPGVESVQCGRQIRAAWMDGQARP